MTSFPWKRESRKEKKLKQLLRSSILSFWLVQSESTRTENLSSLTEGFPTSGNDNHWNRVRYDMTFAKIGKQVTESACKENLH
jgi:hypothetical protein